MGYVETDLTPDEVATMTRLRRELQEAKYPDEYVVDRETLELIEHYYQRTQREEFARWTAAGKPDDWLHPLWMTWTKTGRGVQFKGCELVLA